MPGTLTPGQMFDHTVIELSGRSLTYPLDFAAPAEPTDDAAVLQGGICSLNAAGNIVTGLGDAVNPTVADLGALTPMGLIAIQGRDEFDANSDVGNISGGVQSALVCSGGYEVQTTEFVADTYLPNEPLTWAYGETATPATDYRGLVTKAAATYSDNHLIGVVSRSEQPNEYNKSVLSFWTVFCPAVSVTP